MSEAVIRTTGLTKDFGAVRALDGLDLEVQRGEVFGFLGPNGAGKSTTIRILLDLIRPTMGEAQVLGLSPRHRAELRARIGYLPGELRMPGRSTAGAYLGYLADLRGGAGKRLIPPLAERFDLDVKRPIRKLSKGNKQKIGVIQAFMHEPELLILDEPTSGLDPLLQREFQNLVHERQRTGVTVFMSSHVLSEVEDIAERVAIIRSGRLVDVDNLQTLRHKAGQHVELRFGEPVGEEMFNAVAGLTKISVRPDRSGEGSVLVGVLRGEPDELIKVAATHHIVGLRVADPELENLFLDFYRESGPGSKPVDEPMLVRHA